VFATTEAVFLAAAHDTLQNDYARNRRLLDP